MISIRDELIKRKATWGWLGKTLKSAPMNFYGRRIYAVVRRFANSNILMLCCVDADTDEVYAMTRVSFPGFPENNIIFNHTYDYMINGWNFSLREWFVKPIIPKGGGDDPE